MRLIREELVRRGHPLNVAIIGCGWWGSGVARSLLRIPGMTPRILVDTDISKCLADFRAAGISGNDVLLVERPADMRLIRDRRYAVMTDMSLLADVPSGVIDVIHEATGHIVPGAQAALLAIERRIPFTTVNAEMDATIGLVLARKAASRGVPYSNSDGDQPGCLARILDDVTAWGFAPRIVGNNKHFLDHHQTPEGVMPWVPAGGNPYMLSAAADGSKLALELCVVANARNYPPLKRGMHGPRAGKSALISVFREVADLDSLTGGHIDYSLGTTEPDMGGPVFVIAHTLDDRLRAEMKHYKKGPGPHYLFFRDHHLGSIEAPATIAEAALFRSPALCPTTWCADVITVAKRDLRAGAVLDAIGGFDYYGLADTSTSVRRDRILPLGLAAGARLTHDIGRDDVITLDQVELDESPVVLLRREQDSIPAAAPTL